MERVNNNPIILINDKRQTKFIFSILAFCLLMSFGAVYYTMGVHSAVTDIGVVKELEAIKYNNQLYLNLVAHVDSVQDAMLKIQVARMDTAAANRADYTGDRRQRDSIIAYETRIRVGQVEELKQKGLWK